MAKRKRLKFDEIGYWSEVKLDIIREYAKAYSKILAAQKGFKHVYIDAFAGAGQHVSKVTGQIVAGSPLNALGVQPPFVEYHFVDLIPWKIGHLKALVQERFGPRNDVFIYEGDCNRVLLEHVFQRVRFEDFRRGLCLLDPYGLHLDWEVIKKSGKMGTIDMFLNFPVTDMNRNVLWGNPEDVDPADIKRMSAYWGDESWREAAYSRQEPDLLGDQLWDKEPNEKVAEAFRQRLRKDGGFGHVPEPMPMRNTTGAIVYYLFFASQKPVAQHIVEDIFKKHKGRRSV